MFILKIDPSKCDNCKECDDIIPGFSYREHGLLISPSNFKAYEGRIAGCFAKCKLKAIDLEELY